MPRYDVAYALRRSFCTGASHTLYPCRYCIYSLVDVAANMPSFATVLAFVMVLYRTALHYLCFFNYRIARHPLECLVARWYAYPCSHLLRRPLTKSNAILSINYTFAVEDPKQRSYRTISGRLQSGRLQFVWATRLGAVHALPCCEATACVTHAPLLAHPAHALFTLYVHVDIAYPP